MLDYEIKGYVVYWVKAGAVAEFYRQFDTEEQAVTFIKENRTNKWVTYRIEQVRYAIIDF